MSDRSKAKDALAWTVLHGGWFAAKAAVTSGALAAGFIDKHTAKNLTKMLSKMVPKMKDRAWRHYERTGSIWEMVEIAAGTSPEDIISRSEYKTVSISELEQLISKNDQYVPYLTCNDVILFNISYTVRLEKMNGQACIRIPGGSPEVIFVKDIKRMYELKECGKTYVVIETFYQRYDFLFPEAVRSQWEEAIQSLR